jgi:hypothetical protein
MSVAYFSIFPSILPSNRKEEVCLYLEEEFLLQTIYQQEPWDI